MNPVPNKLMPWLQAIAAMMFIVLFCAVVLAPMVGLHSADDDMKETLKNIMFILVGFLFGSSLGSVKKDDQNAQLTAQIVAPTPPTPPLTAGTPTGKIDDPVAVFPVPPQP